MARPDGALPPIELIDDSPTPPEVAVRRGAGRRGRRGALVVGVLAVVAVLAVAQGDDPPARNGDPTTTTAPVPVEGGGFEAAAAGYLTGAPRPLLRDAAGARLLVGSAAGWRYVDPSTGWVAEVPALDGFEADRMVPVAGGVVVVDRRGARVLRFATGRRREVTAGEPLQVQASPLVPEAPGGRAELHSVVDVLGAGRADRLWVVAAPVRPGAEPALVATLVDLDGSRRSDPVPLPADPVAATDAALAFDAGGRTYLAGPDGLRDLGTGVVLAATGPWLGRAVCDQRARCTPEIRHPDAGTVVTGAVLPTRAVGAGELAMAQADDGSLATVALRPRTPTPGPGATTTVSVTRPDGRSLRTEVVDPRSAPVWLPGGDHLLLLTGLGLVVITEDDGALVAATVPRLAAEGATSVVVVLRSEAPAD